MSDSYLPLYMQFYNTLRSEIMKCPVGENLPPERTLSEKFNVKRVTVRRALKQLQEEGYIERIQGSGTRVLCHEIHNNNPVLFLLCQGAQSHDRLGEPFYASSIEAIEERLRLYERRLVYFKIREGESIANICNLANMSAVILVGKADQNLMDQCAAFNLPMVAFNTPCESLPSVTVDNFGGAALAARHLIGLGHRRIGFIHAPGNAQPAGNSEVRLNSFRAEIRAAGLPEDSLCVVPGDWTEEGGYRAAKELLEREPRVTALFGGNDSMSIGAIRAAKEMGLSVPGQLSVVGFDGIDASRLISPALTTVQVDARAMAEAVCMMLDHVIAYGAGENIRVVVNAKLIERESTAAPGGAE